MRRRLVLYGVGVTVAVVLAFLVPFLVLVHSLAEDRALSAARQDAQNLAVVASHDSPGLAAVLASLNTTGPNRSTVFRPDGSAVGAPAVADASVAAARGGQAFTARTTGGAEVLLPVEGSSGLSVVRVFVPDDVLTAGVDRATLSWCCSASCWWGSRRSSRAASHGGSPRRSPMPPRPPRPSPRAGSKRASCRPGHRRS